MDNANQRQAFLDDVCCGSEMLREFMGDNVSRVESGEARSIRHWSNLYSINMDDGVVKATARVFIPGEWAETEGKRRYVDGHWEDRGYSWKASGAD